MTPLPDIFTALQNLSQRRVQTAKEIQRLIRSTAGKSQHLVKRHSVNLNIAQHSSLDSCRGKLQIAGFSPVCLFGLIRQWELGLGNQQEQRRSVFILGKSGGGEKLGCLFFLAVFGK